MSDADEYLPEHIDALLAYLASQFPPRCMKPKEDLVEHQRYAAVSQFIEELIVRRSDEVATTVLPSRR